MIQSVARIGFGFALGAIATLVALPAFGEPLVADGQLVKRSDDFIYLIRNGQRHWVQPVPLSDDDINAIPEAEAYTTGLAPIGSGAVAGVSRSTGDYVVTFEGSKRGVQEPLEYYRPPAGSERLMVSVSVQYVGPDTGHFNRGDFEVQLSDNTRGDPVSSSAVRLLNYGDLLAGQTVSGTVPFDVPIGMSVTALLYTPSEYDATLVMIPLS